MKSSLFLRTGICLSAVLAVGLSGSLVMAQGAKEKARAPAKPAPASKPAAKTAAKAPTAADVKLNQHLAANMKFFGVLSRYAQTLSNAKDAATAHQAATKLDAITKDAITAGEELVKLGKPDAEIEMRLAGDADLKMTSQTVAEQTRAAVKSLASNAEVKTILAPAVENFQAALNRVQQAADEPQEVSKTPPAPAPDNKTAPAPPAPADKPEKTAAEATEVPAPPR